MSVYKREASTVVLFIRFGSSRNLIYSNHYHTMNLLSILLQKQYDEVVEKRKNYIAAAEKLCSCRHVSRLGNVSRVGMKCGHQKLHPVPCSVPMVLHSMFMCLSVRVWMYMPDQCARMWILNICCSWMCVFCMCEHVYCIHCCCACVTTSQHASIVLNTQTCMSPHNST